MTRLWIGAFLLCAVAPFGFAQRGGGFHGGGVGRPGIGGGRWGGAGGKLIGNRWGRSNWGSSFWGGGGFGWGGFGWGGFGGWGYPFADDSEPSPSVVVVPVTVQLPEPPMPPPPPPEPARLVVKSYSWAATAEPAANTFAILSKDGTRRSAIAVWVQDNELRYRSPDGVSGRIKIETIDRDATLRANAEHGLKFWLPDHR